MFYSVLNNVSGEVIDFQKRSEAIKYARVVAATDPEGIAYVDIQDEIEGIVDDIKINKPGEKNNATNL